MTLEKRISDYGYVLTAENYSEKPHKVSDPKSDLYTARIVNLMLPYIKESISESKFITIQEKLRAIVNECMKK